LFGLDGEASRFGWAGTGGQDRGKSWKEKTLQRLKGGRDSHNEEAGIQDQKRASANSTIKSR